ncbi:MAG: hypothetical protein WCE45_08480 [Sedimentisphaerales bacterium]
MFTKTSAKCPASPMARRDPSARRPPGLRLAKGGIEFDYFAGCPYYGLIV